MAGQVRTRTQARQERVQEDLARDSKANKSALQRMSVAGNQGESSGADQVPTPGRGDALLEGWEHVSLY